MRKIGIILLVAGLLLTIFTGFNLVTRKKVVDIGELEIKANQNHKIAWSPMIGAIVMVIGGGFYIMGRKKG